MVEAIAELERGRDACAKRKWVDAYQSLAAADQATPLTVEDLELLSVTAVRKEQAPSVDPTSSGSCV